MCLPPLPFFLFFFNDTATTEIYTLSLHDALPISPGSASAPVSSTTGSIASARSTSTTPGCPATTGSSTTRRSEEHTSELQSQSNLVCRLLLEKKKKKNAKAFTKKTAKRAYH